MPSIDDAMLSVLCLVHPKATLIQQEDASGSLEEAQGSCLVYAVHLPPEQPRGAAAMGVSMQCRDAAMVTLHSGFGGCRSAHECDSSPFSVTSPAWMGRAGP